MLVLMTSLLETELVSVERVKEYSVIDTEVNQKLFHYIFMLNVCLSYSFLLYPFFWVLTFVPILKISQTELSH